MNKKLREALEEFSSYTVMSEKDFLLRKNNNYNTNVPLAVYDVANFNAVEKKIIDIFGNAELKKGEDYVLIKPVDFFNKTRFTFGDLIEIIWRLRDPDGCPWDRAQTPETIRTNIIEEAYELIEAIDLLDNDKIREECGDVILQGAFCSVMTEEKGEIGTNDVITALCEKLIHRHTHIFGKDKATDEKQALMFWEKAKAVEKGQKTIVDKLNSVPTTFTALQKANKVQKIIKKTGFDFPTEKEGIDKIYEEIREFINATGKEKEKEAGDMLFSVVNVLRLHNIDPEVALNGTTDRFSKRFSYVIKKAEEQGKKVEELSLEEMEVFYNQAKIYE